jgi:hypothetical protein
MLNIARTIVGTLAFLGLYETANWVVDYFIETVPVDIQTFLIIMGFVSAVTAGLVAFNRYVK